MDQPPLLQEKSTLTQLQQALAGADDGELFLERTQSEVLVFDDGSLRNASYDQSEGFGLRAINGTSTAYAHSSELSGEALARAVSAVKHSPNGTKPMVLPAEKVAQKDLKHPSLYTATNPLHGMAFDQKVNLLAEMDAYARALDPRVHQVSVSLVAEQQHVHILRADGSMCEDIRPIVRLNVNIVLEHEGRREQGSTGLGGRADYRTYVEESVWKEAAREALRQADINMQSVPGPAGEMTVLLGPGWPGVLLHEAVGHGLEGDFNRKQTSAFSNRMGTQVAAKGVTVVDDGTLPNRRGSLNVDDEGTPTSCTTLIEDGTLVGYMQDRMNARLMEQQPTGNGRRESYACAPMPRMTNTYMHAGNDDPADLLAEVKDGIYAVNFGGGQVDITSGQFVFSASEAYRVEQGKVTEPIKGVTLIGHGPEVLTRIRGIGNDLKLDPGIGTCGKDGQSVPVGVGQPTLLIDGLTVGGTEA